MAAGFLLVVVSPPAVFAGAAVLLAAAGAVTLRFARTVIPLSGGDERGASVVRETVSVVRRPHVGGMLVLSGLRTFVRGMWLAIAVIASLHLLHAGSGGVGLLMMAAGVGALVAVPVSASLVDRRRLGTPAGLALVCCGIPFVVLAGVPLLDVAVALVIVWGVGMAVADVATSSLIYRFVDAPMLPRVTAAIESAKLGLEGLGALLAPLLVTFVGIRAALVVAGLPLPVVVALGWRRLHRVDDTGALRMSVLELLREVPFLRGLDLVTLESLVGCAVPSTVAAGTEVVTQGDHGDRFYAVHHGEADVLVDGFVVGSVGPRGSFGEKALLRDVPRTATVRARTAMGLVALQREDFLAALTGQAEMVTGLQSAPLRLDGHWSADTGAEILSRVSLLSQLDHQALSDLAARATRSEWPDGATVVRQGERGRDFYVVLSGAAEVLVDGAVVGRLQPGDQFGEIALLHDVPRRATVTASGALGTLCLHRDDFVPAVRSQMLLG